MLIHSAAALSMTPPASHQARGGLMAGRRTVRVLENGA